MTTTNRVFQVLLFALLFTALTVVSCNRKTAEGAQEEGDRAEEGWTVSENQTAVASFRRTGCFGQCPIYRVSFYANGVAKYKGEAHVDYTGDYVGTYDRDRLQEILDFAEKNGFFEMEDSYPVDDRYYIPDMSNTITMLSADQQTKTINHNNYGPDELKEIENKLQRLVYSIVWQDITTK